MTGCANEKDDETFQAFDETLIQCNKLLRTQTGILIEELIRKTKDPRTAYKAEIIKPKAVEINIRTDSLLTEIDSIKNFFNRGLVLPTLEINSLSNKINTHIKFLRDSLFEKSYSAEWQHWLSDQPSQIQTEKLKYHLATKSKGKFNVHLSRIQNILIQMELRTITWCNLQTMSLHESYDAFNAIIGQNAKVLRVGDSLEIVAGIGEFSKKPAQFVINGKVIETNKMGMAAYKQKTGQKPGTYSIPVIISYQNLDGEMMKRTFDIEYTLVDKVPK